MVDEYSNNDVTSLFIKIDVPQELDGKQKVVFIDTIFIGGAKKYDY